MNSQTSYTTYPGSLDKSYDGADDEVQASSKIVQVVLKGPTIRDAWRRNTTIVEQSTKTTLHEQEAASLSPQGLDASCDRCSPVQPLPWY